MFRVHGIGSGRFPLVFAVTDDPSDQGNCDHDRYDGTCFHGQFVIGAPASSQACICCNSHDGSAPVGGITEGCRSMTRCFIAPWSAAFLMITSFVKSGDCAPVTWHPGNEQRDWIRGLIVPEKVMFSVSQKLPGYSSSSTS